MGKCNILDCLDLCVDLDCESDVWHVACVEYYIRHVLNRSRLYYDYEQSQL